MCLWNMYAPCDAKSINAEKIWSPFKSQILVLKENGQ